MGKRSINSRAKFVMTRPEPGEGPVRSVQRVLDLIDTTHPSWPHVAAILREFADAGVDIDEASAAIAVKLGMQRWDDGRPQPCTQTTLASASRSIVYYIRRGSLIKIGTTVDPYTRFRDLIPDEILAVEPGGRAQEQMRHRQFQHLRAGGEYFRDEPELRDHAGRIRDTYGAPDPEWPTTDKLARRTAPKTMWLLPSPKSTETMTAAEAVAELGIKDATLRGWVHRGLIQVAGRDSYMERQVFYREHLIALRDSPRKRIVQRL